MNSTSKTRCILRNYAGCVKKLQPFEIRYFLNLHDSALVPLIPRVRISCLAHSISPVHTGDSVGDSVGDFSPGKCDQMNDMQKLRIVHFWKATLSVLYASSLIWIRQKHKIANKIACMNQTYNMDNIRTYFQIPGQVLSPPIAYRREDGCETH